MKISVIVPVYRVEPFIHRCIDSILNQTFTDFELILVDDGSPDNCGVICDEYAAKDNRIIVIHKENGGLSDARNAGIDWAFANSDSEWITFIDSDDWVHTKYLELLFDTAIKNDADVCSCGHQCVADYQEDIPIGIPAIYVGEAEQLFLSVNNYWYYNLVVSWCRLYRKECFKTIRFPLGRLHEDDYVTYKILFLCKKNAVVREILYYYYQNEKSIMHSKPTIKRLIDLFDAYEQQIHFFYDNKSKVFFQGSFKFLCNTVEEHYERYKYDRVWLKELMKRKKTIRRFSKDYYDFLPEYVKKHGWKKATKAYQLKNQVFKSDYLSNKRDKGILFALLWAIKAKINTNMIDFYYTVLGKIILLKSQ